MEQSEEKRIDIFDDLDMSEVSVTLQDVKELVEYKFTNDELKHLCTLPCSVNLTKRNMYLRYERTMMKKFKAKHGDEIDEPHYLRVTYKKFKKKFCNVHYERFMRSQCEFEKLNPEFKLVRKSKMKYYMDSLKESSTEVENDLEITNCAEIISEGSSSTVDTVIEQPTFANNSQESVILPLNVQYISNSTEGDPLNNSSEDIQNFLHGCCAPVEDSESQVMFTESQVTYGQFNNNANIVTSTQVPSLDVRYFETIPFEQ